MALGSDSGRVGWNRLSGMDEARDGQCVHGLRIPGCATRDVGMGHRRLSYAMEMEASLVCFLP